MKKSRDERPKVPDYEHISYERTDEHTLEKLCRHCNKTFWCTPEADPMPDFCCVRCARKWHAREKKEASERAKHAVMVATVQDNPLTPQETARIRNRVATHVKDQIDIAAKVVSGAPGPDGKPIKWSSVQARVFSTLLNKVLPDLSASQVKHEHRNVDLTELSREELERLAAGASTLAEKAEPEIIDVTPTSPSEDKDS